MVYLEAVAMTSSNDNFGYRRFLKGGRRQVGLEGGEENRKTARSHICHSGHLRPSAGTRYGRAFGLCLGYSANLLKPT
jgi:hypothetical protein